MDDEEIKRLKVIELNNNIECNKISNLKEYDKFKKGFVFICNDCSFVDKYGNLGIKILIALKTFKSHCRTHNNIILKGSV